MTNEEFLESISLEGEEWCDVVGYEGLYAVSNFSRVASLRSKGRIMTVSLNSDGYGCLCLTKDNKSVKERLHRIVAKAWLPNPNNYPYVEHIDANRANSSISNLRWCTQSMNQNNPITKLRMADNSRKDKSKSMEVVCLKDDIVVKIYPYLSKVVEDGHFVASVWRCLKHHPKYPHHHGYKWMYLSDYESSYQ